jgi:PhzF family phenazine biosynthesis protein
MSIDKKSAMHIVTYLLDTFTSVPFKGNPTAVCVIEENISSDKMLSIANELNLPVTAFIARNHDSDHEYSIRYFTPVTEIPACGHATLASAKVAMLIGDESINPQFITIDDLLVDTEFRNELIFLSYPQYKMQPYQVGESTTKSLGVKNFKTVGFSAELETLFIEMEDPVELRNIEPDYSMLVESNNEIKEVVITSASDTYEYDFLLRSFCPWIGINEDPVTGSVHSVLAGFWEERTNKTVMKAFQASARGGEVFVEIKGNKVKLGGETVVVLKGELHLI